MQILVLVLRDLPKTANRVYYGGIIKAKKSGLFFFRNSGGFRESLGATMDPRLASFEGLLLEDLARRSSVIR